MGGSDSSGAPSTADILREVAAIVQAATDGEAKRQREMLVKIMEGQKKLERQDKLDQLLKGQEDLRQQMEQLSARVDGLAFVRHRNSTGGWALSDQQHASGVPPGKLMHTPVTPTVASTGLTLGAVMRARKMLARTVKRDKQNSPRARQRPSALSAEDLSGKLRVSVSTEFSPRVGQPRSSSSQGASSPRAAHSEQIQRPPLELLSPTATTCREVDIDGVEEAGLCLNIPTGNAKAFPRQDSSMGRRASATRGRGRPSATAINLESSPAEGPTFGKGSREVWTLNADHLCAVFSGESLLLPDSIPGTLIDGLFLLSVVYETISSCVHGATDKWDASVSTWEIAGAAAASFVALCYALTRLRVARLDGWDLIDEDADRVWSMYRSEALLWDCILVPPWDLMLLPVSSRAFRIAQLVRPLRLVRVPQLFQSSNPLRPDRRVRALVLTAYYIIGHHFIACIWLLMHTDDHPEITVGGAEQGPWMTYELWITALYWAVQTTTSVGFGDVGVPGGGEWGPRLYTIACMSAGVMLVSAFVGYFSAQFLATNAVESAIKDKKERMDALMAYYSIPWSIQKEAFYLYPSLLAASAVDYCEVLSILPPFMQQKIGTYVRMKLIQAVPMFHDAELECVMDLSEALDELIVPPGTYLLREGEVALEMYFLAHGVVEVLSANAEGEEQQLVILRGGSWFGEIALLCETTRTASVRSVTACDMFCLSREHFKTLLARHPNSHLATAIAEEVKRRLGGDTGLQLQARQAQQSGREALYECAQSAVGSDGEAPGRVQPMPAEQDASLDWRGTEEDLQDRGDFRPIQHPPGMVDAEHFESPPESPFSSSPDPFTQASTG